MKLRNIIFIIVLVLGVLLFAIFDLANNKASGIKAYKLVLSTLLLLLGVLYTIKTSKLK